MNIYVVVQQKVKHVWKRPLAELIRENQEAYNKFITHTLLKMMRMLGVSSGSDEN